MLHCTQLHFNAATGRCIILRLLVAGKYYAAPRLLFRCCCLYSQLLQHARTFDDLLQHSRMIHHTIMCHPSCRLRPRPMRAPCQCAALAPSGTSHKRPAMQQVRRLAIHCSTTIGVVFSATSWVNAYSAYVHACQGDMALCVRPCAHVRVHETHAPVTQACQCQV